MPTAILDNDFSKANDTMAPFGIPMRDLIAKAIAEERERCAKIAEAHKGSAARKRKTEGRQLHMGSEAYAEIVSEERGEDIAAEMIAKAIRTA